MTNDAVGIFNRLLQDNESRQSVKGDNYISNGGIGITPDTFLFGLASAFNGIIDK